MGCFTKLVPDIIDFRRLVYHMWGYTVTFAKKSALELISRLKNMRNRFLTQFYVRHSGATFFLKVISRKARADWSWRLPNSEYQMISKGICTVIQPHFSQIPCMHPDTLEGRRPTSIGSNFAANNFQIFFRTTMSDVKLCQESIPHVFIAWKSLPRKKIKKVLVLVHLASLIYENQLYP